MNFLESKRVLQSETHFTQKFNFKKLYENEHSKHEFYFGWKLFQLCWQLNMFLVTEIFLSAILLYIFQVKTLITKGWKKGELLNAVGLWTAAVQIYVNFKTWGCFCFASCVFTPILSVTLGLSFIWCLMKQMRELMWEKLSDPVC